MSDTSSTSPTTGKTASKASTTVSKAKKAAAATKAAALETVSEARNTASASTAQWREQAGEFAEQAKTTAREAATTAKNTTGDALHGLSKLISETAETVDSKLGPQYGDYARKAAETVAGAAQSLDEKDIDQLTEEARNFVRKSPAVAIGAAAVVGFVLMRMMRGSSDKS